MDEPWKHYAKWNKTDTEANIIWLHFYNLPRIDKFIETESKIKATRSWGCHEFLFNESRVSVWDHENVLWWWLHNTVRVPNAIELYT